MLTARDVDALCACKILQTLLKADSVQHTIVPVSGPQELLSVFSSYSDKVLHVCLCVCMCGCLKPMVEMIFIKPSSQCDAGPHTWVM